MSSRGQQNIRNGRGPGRSPQKVTFRQIKEPSGSLYFCGSGGGGESNALSPESIEIHSFKEAVMLHKTVSVASVRRAWV